MPLLDALLVPWSLPSLGWRHVQAINRVLRSSGEDLALPKGADGVSLCDLHGVEVQQWLLTYPGAPICLGAILLNDQAEAMQLDAEAFATRWRGDAADRLRAAIWEEWLHYLPSAARTLAAQIDRSVQEMRAKSLTNLDRTFNLLIEGGAIQQDEKIQAAQTEITKLKAKLQPTAKATKPADPGVSEMSGGGPGCSDLTQGLSV